MRFHMIANLSIVLDRNKKVRLDVLENLELSKIDEYTTNFTSSSEIRRIFQEELGQFLIENQELIKRFKENSSKQGTLVIVYSDEQKRLHRMRVLYQENQAKTNPELVLKKICSVLRNQEEPTFTIELMRYFSFFLCTPFHLREIEKVERSMNHSSKAKKQQNQKLLNLIRNHILYTLEKNFEKGYFYIRLLDAYLERKGFLTTKRTAVIKSGKIEISKLPKETCVLKKNPISERKTGQELTLHMEEDGQYTFWNAGVPSYTRDFEESFFKYEHYLENSTEVQKELKL